MIVVGALVLCVGLGACGRKGPLEGPPGSNLPRAPRQTVDPTIGATTPESTVRNANSAAVAPPKRAFLLDPLVQ
jgi:predicted small lipoprotein YifL